MSLAARVVTALPPTVTDRSICACMTGGRGGWADFTLRFAEADIASGAKNLTAELLTVEADAWAPPRLEPSRPRHPDWTGGRQYRDLIRPAGRSHAVQCAASPAAGGHAAPRGRRAVGSARQSGWQPRPQPRHPRASRRVHARCSGRDRGAGHGRSRGRRTAGSPHPRAAGRVCGAVAPDATHDEWSPGSTRARPRSVSCWTPHRVELLLPTCYYLKLAVTNLEQNRAIEHGQLATFAAARCALASALGRACAFSLMRSPAPAQL